MNPGLDGAGSEGAWMTGRHGPPHGEEELVVGDGAVRVAVEEREERVDVVRREPGQDKGDSTSLQRECSARARSEKSIHASRPLREMIARPKISQNEWKTAEIGAFEVGNFALFCCPACGGASGAARAWG